ncbi:MAG: DUF3015 family protein [Myxococcota bacterium]
MKKIFCALALCATVAPGSALAAGYGTAGCGLGSLVFGDDPGIVQIFAATTNATFGTQTFGITTGTSNCVDGGGLAAADKKAFVKMNYASLMRDAASGKGEYLSAFANILGCDAAVQGHFFQATQKNHSELFNTKADVDATLQSVDTMLSSDPTLAQSCEAAGA